MSCEVFALCDASDISLWFQAVYRDVAYVAFRFLSSQSTSDANLISPFMPPDSIPPNVCHYTIGNRQQTPLYPHGPAAHRCWGIAPKSVSPTSPILDVYVLRRQYNDVRGPQIHEAQLI